jgi:hypothetical protein
LYARNLGPAKLVGCWSVNLHSGGYHVNHVVPVEAQDAVAQQGWLKFGEPRYPCPGLAAERLVQPQAGRLVLFPSYLWHGTTAIHGQEPRLTIAFDAVSAPV